MSLSEFEKDVLEHIMEEVVEPWYDTKIRDGFYWDTVTMLLDSRHKDQQQEIDAGYNITPTIRKYIYENEEDILKYCLEGKDNGIFSETIFEQRMMEPVKFLQSVEKECALSLLNQTQLRNLKDFDLDREHCDLIFNVLQNVEANINLMTKEESFQNACYDIYRKQWLRDRGMSLADEKDIIDTIYKEEHKDDPCFMRVDAKALYLTYEGIDGNGTIYASKSEFLRNEYQDIKTMHNLLPKQMVEWYDRFQCVVDSKIPFPSKVPTLSEEKEQETLAYLQSLDLNKALNQTFTKPFELLQKLGVDAEHMDDCETLLLNTHIGRCNGHFSLIREAVVPVTFDKEMKEDLSYTLKHFAQEKEFMQNEGQFKYTLFENYCQKNYGVSVPATDKHYDKFLKNIYTDNQRMQAYTNFNQQMLKDRYDGVPYKEKEGKTVFIQRSRNFINDRYHWDAGKAWRDVTLNYDGKDKQLLLDRISQVTNRFRTGLDVPMVESGLIYNAGNISQEGLKKLRAIAKKCFGRVVEKRNDYER